MQNIFFLTILFISFACNPKEDKQSPNNYSQQELRILLADPVETLDPLKIIYSSDWKVASNIYEGLVKLDSNSLLQNDLADSIIISDDHLSYNFILKEDVYFHDNPCFKNGKGRKLNAYDIKYVFERLAHSSNNFPNWNTISNVIEGMDDFNSKECDSISGIKVIDSLKFSIKLIQPNSSFLIILTSPNFYIIPKESVEYYKERFEFYPVGTGPFRISEHLKYEKIVLVRNENYYKKDENNNSLPYLSSIEYKTIEESESRFGELVKKNIHLINANQEEYLKFSHDSLLLNQFSIKKVDKGSGIKFWGFFFGGEQKIENFKNLRKSIASSFDRSFIKNTFFSNIIAETLVPKYHLGNSELNLYRIQNQNYSRSQKNIQFHDTVNLMANIVYRDLIEIEKTLTKLNIPYKRLIKPANYYSEIVNVKPTLFRVSMIPAFPDPIEYYALFYSKNKSGINLGNFSNKEYDQIFEYVKTENDRQKRIEAYIKLESILKEEVAALYLTHQGPVNYIFSKKIKNIQFNFTVPDFTKAYFD